MAALEDDWTGSVTVRQAYLAMQEFLLRYWKAGGETEEQVRFLMIQISGDPSDPFERVDPQHEREWFEAVARVRAV